MCQNFLLALQSFCRPVQTGGKVKTQNIQNQPRRSCSKVKYKHSIQSKFSLNRVVEAIKCTVVLGSMISATISEKHSHMWPAAIYGIAHPHHAEACRWITIAIILHNMVIDIDGANAATNFGGLHTVANKIEDRGGADEPDDDTSCKPKSLYKNPGKISAVLKYHINCQKIV